ncbi:MAG: YihY/virulence factor BrkB family protein [Crocinitomicaceae bacterium]|nr:YihY/virulence factor BrkB family protein [Crocinitomicaceae bacterium]
MALVPLLYLSITFFGQFVGQQTMNEIIGSVLRDQVGIQDTDGIMDFLGEVDLGSGNVMLQVFGVLALMFSCTAILNSLKRSINEFYGVDQRKLGRKKRVVRGVLFRLISMLFILGITTFIIVLYFAETIFLSFGNRFFEDLELVNWFFSGVARHGIPVVMNVVVFSFVFKYLHDGVLKWRMAIHGGLATGILLYFGQLLIKFYLMNYFFASSGGVAGTMLIILVWVYYSSQILFLGAKFTAAYAKLRGVPIVLRD